MAYVTGEWISGAVCMYVANQLIVDYKNEEREVCAVSAELRGQANFAALMTYNF